MQMLTKPKLSVSGCVLIGLISLAYLSRSTNRNGARMALSSGQPLMIR